MDQPWSRTSSIKLRSFVLDVTVFAVNFGNLPCYKTLCSQPAAAPPAERGRSTRNAPEPGSRWCSDIDEAVRCRTGHVDDRMAIEYRCEARFL
jgi:hypothetical protein